MQDLLQSAAQGAIAYLEDLPTRRVSPATVAAHASTPRARRDTTIRVAEEIGAEKRAGR